MTRGNRLFRRRALALALAALAAPAAPGFDAIECDTNEIFGDAATVLGWGTNPASAMGAIEVDNQGAPASSLGNAAVNAAWETAVTNWVGITSGDNLAFAARANGAAIGSAALESSLNNSRLARTWMVVQATTAAGPSTGWAAITATDVNNTLGLTLSRFDTTTRLTVDSDILINDDNTGGVGGSWDQALPGTSPGVGRFSLYSVIAHEIGHYLGLDHTIQAGAAMAPVLATGVTVDLGNDEANGMLFLYTGSGAVKPPPDRNDPALTSCVSNGSGGGGPGGVLNPPPTTPTAGFGRPTNSCAAAPGGGGWMIALVCFGMALGGRMRGARGG